MADDTAALLRAELEAALQGVAARWAHRYVIESATVTLAASFAPPARNDEAPAPTPRPPARVTVTSMGDRHLPR